MNFNKIEIIGFKSFADKTVIEFNAGVTGIVGPNGCGKSNVADAIRWVLGEQSAKSLRGSSMQDVIFSGTQNRKSLSYCEVNLYFDNADRKLFDVEYNEVIITRKLFRSGESEYYINKQPSRLRDIVALLHDCGISKDGYSVIGQGKIEQIFSAKPDDRRAIFEEATGIAKFKSRRAETERRLNRTKDNLNTYVNVLAELERMLKPLEKDSETAKKYLDLAEKLKHQEINSYIYKYDGVADAKFKIRTKLNAVTGEIEAKQTALADADNRYNTYFRDISLADKNIADLHEKLLEKTVGIEKKSGESKVYGERINYFKSEIERLSVEIDKAKERLTAIDKESEERAQKEKSLKIDLAEKTKRAEEIRRRLAELNAEIMTGESAAERTREEMIRTMESLSDYKENIGSLAAKKSVMSDRQRDVVARVEALYQKKAGIELDIEESRARVEEFLTELATLRREVKVGKERLVELSREIAKCDERLYHLNATISSVSAKMKILEGLKESFEGYQLAVKRLMNAAKSDNAVNARIKGVVASLVKTEQKYEVAIETALGGAMQNVVTATPEDAKYLIEYLKRQHAGRVTFLPVSSVKPRMESEYARMALKEKGALGLANELVKFDRYYEPVVKSLLGNTVIVDNIDNATNIANRYRFSFKIVTLDGDVFSPAGSMTGGSRRQDTGNLLGNDRELDKAKTDLASAEKEMAEVKAKRTAMDTERTALTEKTNKNETRLVALRENQIAEEQRLESLESLNDKNDGEIEQFQDEIRAVQESLAQIDEQARAAEESGEKMKAMKESAQTAAAERSTATDTHKKERDALTEQNTQLQVELTAVNAQFGTLKLAEEQAEEERALLLKSIRANELNRDADEQNIEDIKREAETVALSVEEQAEVKAIRTRLSGVEQEKENLNNALTETDAERVQIRADIEKLNEKKYNEELALAKVDSDIEFAEQRIAEAYELDYEGCQAFRDPEFDVSSSAQEINRLKRQINALGNINLGAIESYEENFARYREMNEQKEDMEKGRDDLQTALDTLTQEMLKQFNEGFIRINENFGKIFKELFGGGTAKLELDYEGCEDPLDANIEIIAEPPGKKLTKISLLSGGERSLTAIAILFAILRLSPMPFCVLDEIEAALDEANVQRVAKYLKRFSDETQFIMITHRKPTMEMADALYGVTMEEKGVSKMVSVKLADIVDEIEEE